MKPLVILCVLLWCPLLAELVPVAPHFNGGSFPSLLLKVKRNKIQPKELHEECEQCQPKPLPRDLNTHHLTALLGRPFDTSVVSIKKPENFNVETSTKVSLSEASEAKRKTLREFVRNGTRNMADFSGRLSRNMERFVMGWLLQQEKCPLVHTWRDMGPHFWPRYVKRATCVSKQCSISPGSSCEPSRSRYFPLLRWHCIDKSTALFLPKWTRRPRPVRRSGYLCRWYRFVHPITTECSCTCAAALARQ